MSGLFALTMIELEKFYNDGFGWVCRECETEGASVAPDEPKSRLMQEGEAENKNPTFSSALAKWLDPSHRTLICPRCGITEEADKR
jgi:hypothetical protein